MEEMEKFMEFKLSSLFQVKLVTKMIVLGSQGAPLMHEDDFSFYDNYN